jgi:four helix bundle protein
MATPRSPKSCMRRCWRMKTRRWESGDRRQETGDRSQESGVRSQESGVRRREIGRKVLGPARCFEDLLVWQKSHALTLDVYRQSKAFPKEETYGLRSQLRRACISVPANIAEGFRKRGALDKIRLLNIAQGSLEETRYYLILARDLSYFESTDLLARVAEVSRMLDAYIKGIEERNQ